MFGPGVVSETDTLSLNMWRLAKLVREISDHPVMLLQEMRDTRIYRDAYESLRDWNQKSDEKRGH